MGGRPGLRRFLADPPPAASPAAVPDGVRTVDATVSGVVWTVRVAPGDLVAPGDVLVVLEAMKMEIAVEASVGGRVGEILVGPRDTVGAGDPLLTLLDDGVAAEARARVVSRIATFHGADPAEGRRTIASARPPLQDGLNRTLSSMILARPPPGPAAGRFRYSSTAVREWIVARNGRRRPSARTSSPRRSP